MNEELFQLLEKWRTQIPVDSPRQKSYEISDGKVMLIITITTKNHSFFMKSFSVTCRANVDSVQSTIQHFEQYIEDNE